MLEIEPKNEISSLVNGPVSSGVSSDTNTEIAGDNHPTIKDSQLVKMY